jgi:cation:H+ antiporter
MAWIWIKFLLCSVVVVFAAIKLAEYGNYIAIRTGLGSMFIGLILMAGATSLPELLTTINSFHQSVPDLAAGNMFGSNMFNMLLLGLIGIMTYKTRVLRKVARRHALSGSIASLLIVLGSVFIMANIKISIGWVGLDSILLVIAYIVSIRLIQTNSPSAKSTGATDHKPIGDDIPNMRKTVIVFGVATSTLLLVMPILVQSSKSIAEITGLGVGFIGTALVAIVTSLPELVTTISAIRLKVYDMAIGNLYGSNMFNMLVLGISDIFLLDGRFLGSISSDFVLVGLIGLLMTLLGLVGNLARLERKFFILEIDAVLIILTYFAGMWLIYLRGIGA